MLSFLDFSFVARYFLVASYCNYYSFRMIKLERSPLGKVKER